MLISYNNIKMSEEVEEYYDENEEDHYGFHLITTVI